MHLFFIVASIVLSLGLGWSIGANDAANSLGTAVGARILSLRQTIVLIALCGFLGAVLQGGYVTRTVGKGVVDLDQLPGDQASAVAIVGTLGGCLWVLLATYLKMPVSTSHSIVGAVAGAGWAIGSPVKWKVLSHIFACWVVTPAGAALLGFLLYRLFQVTFYHLVSPDHARPILSLLVVLSGCYSAYSWGANDVANATGLLNGARILSGHVSLLLGGAAIVLGIITWGYKVIETIGARITHLLPLMAFSAQLASALNVHLYTLFGIPVSTSHSIVGAIFGVGLVRGLRMIDLRILREIFLCWIATPLVSGLISFVLLKLVVWFMPL